MLTTRSNSLARELGVRSENERERERERTNDSSVPLGNLLLRLKATLRLPSICFYSVSQRFIQSYIDRLFCKRRKNKHSVKLR